MTILEMKEYLENLTGHITFKYNNKNCGIDPLSVDEFDMWYGDKEITVKSIDEVMDINFFDGKSLQSIIYDIVELDY